jgi:hypothetical protein
MCKRPQLNGSRASERGVRSTEADAAMTVGDDPVDVTEQEGVPQGFRVRSPALTSPRARSRTPPLLQCRRSASSGRRCAPVLRR